MATLDLAIRGGTVVTAADIFRADIGVQAGRIVTVSDAVEGAAREIDASGLLVLPGGIDSHVHIAQPAGPDIVMADDFASATAAAAAGGNTCVMPFAMQIARHLACAPASRNTAGQGGRRVPDRRGVPPDHLGPVAGGARPGAAGAAQGGLHLVQGLHDL